MSIPEVDVTSSQFKADAYAYYARLRAEAPVHSVRLPNGQVVWLVSRYDDVFRLLKDERLVKDRRNAEGSKPFSRLPGMLGFLQARSIARSRCPPSAAREALEIAGVTLPRGALIYGVLSSANRDASQFEEPDRLDLGREKNRHLAFGQGIHYCLGAPLARLEGQVALRKLLERMPSLRMAAPESSLRWRPGLNLRGLDQLPVGW